MQGSWCTIDKIAVPVSSLVLLTQGWANPNVHLVDENRWYNEAEDEKGFSNCINEQ
jgi:hypothetical protein